MTKAEERFSVAYGQADIDCHRTRQAEHVARVLENGKGGSS